MNKPDWYLQYFIWGISCIYDIFYLLYKIMFLKSIDKILLKKLKQWNVKKFEY